MEDKNDNTKAPFHHQLAQLSSFLNSQRPLLLIIGEKNTGKTHLIQDILQTVPLSQKRLRLGGNKSITPRQVLNHLCATLDINTPDKALRFEDQLKFALDRCEKNKKQLILTVDDAHLAPFSVLAALSHLALLQENKTPHLHIILAGSLELKERMSCLVSRTIPQVNLSELNTTTARHYIETVQLARTKITSNTIKTLARKPLTTITAFLARPLSIKQPLTNLWQKHQIKAFSLATLAIVGGALFYSNAPYDGELSPKNLLATNTNHGANPQPTIAANKKIDLLQRQFDILLADSTEKEPLIQLINKFHLEYQAYITQDKNDRHYRIHLGHFNSYQQANAYYAKMPQELKGYHPQVHQIIS